MKIDFSKLADAAIKIAGPILVAAIAHKMATGKLDVKRAVLDAADQALAKARG